MKTLKTTPAWPSRETITFAGCDHGDCPRMDCMRRLPAWEYREDFGGDQDGQVCDGYLAGGVEDGA